MKKLITLLFVALVLPILAQPKSEQGKRKEKIDAMHIAYMNKNLELSDAEKEKFWPVYDEMRDKMKQNRKSMTELKKDLKNFESLKEEEIKQKSEAIFVAQQQELNIKKEYSTRIAGIIGYKRSVKLVSLERQFRQDLKKELEKRRSEKEAKEQEKKE